MNIVTRNFDKISDLVKYCDNETNKIAFRSRLYNLSSQDNKYQFRGTRTFKEAKNLMLNGWDSGAKDLVKGVNLANSQQAPKEVTRAVNDIVGFQANVPNYLQGIPQNMINKRIVKQKQKVVTIVKSISYTSNIKKEQILKDSVKLIQIIQSIEKQGIRANVYTIWNSREGNEQLVIRCKIKSASERLNISKMSFPLMHPSFLRRIMFRCLEVEKEFKNTGWANGYGYPQENNEQFLNKGEYYIPILINEQKLKDIMNDIK